MSIENLEKIRNKFVLLDTNVIIDSLKFSQEFKGFYDILLDHEVKPVLDEVAKFEFMKSSSTKSEFERRRKFLELLFQDYKSLSVNPDLFTVATEIAMLASRAENTEIKLADCLIGAQMVKIASDNLFLVTQNHHDFPAFLFDQLYVHIIRLPNGKLKSLGFYSLNRANFDSLCRELL